MNGSTPPKDPRNKRSSQLPLLNVLYREASTKVQVHKSVLSQNRRMKEKRNVIVPRDLDYDTPVDYSDNQTLDNVAILEEIFKILLTFLKNFNIKTDNDIDQFVQSFTKQLIAFA